ncbi:type II toxin-antitoxin system RelE/ParE family toxin [Granulibacter bethesdensis]|uniref:type II toxin-antitoxin system RelE/ParE family toxin n=1 Tax=Granulibacter bethesdensis TaxID=364410 RepID=UPI00090A0FD4|nr:type II toxin-antitoxin system RelE/ParE family toxin [Granulibacter bethesdensis]APH60057.1 Killer protein [Granulibacter bethesdensis]
MINSFRPKGLEGFFRTGSMGGIQTAHAKKLRHILGLLDVSEKPQDMALPGFRLHSLSGDLQDHWAVKVNANWRVTFRFIGKDVELVDYQDYH